MFSGSRLHLLRNSSLAAFFDGRGLIVAITGGYGEVGPVQCHPILIPILPNSTNCKTFLTWQSFENLQKLKKIEGKNIKKANDFATTHFCPFQPIAKAGHQKMQGRKISQKQAFEVRNESTHISVLHSNTTSVKRHILRQAILERTGANTD